MDTAKRLNEMAACARARFDWFGVHIPKSGILAGPEKCGDFRYRSMPELEIGWDNAHFPLSFRFLMKTGLPGIVARARASQPDIQGVEAIRREVIADFYEALIEYIAAHCNQAERLSDSNPDDRMRLLRIAANCRALTLGAPQTFEQGVQLFYFVWRIRSINYTSCIGRMDLFLRDLYMQDVPSRTGREEAKALLVELWRKLNRMGQGDTLMNLMVGGVDEEGRSVESDLSLLIMEVTRQVALSEPHINARLHEGMTEEYLRAIEEMIADGQGQPTLYFDEAIVPALKRRGYPERVARCYANDGCAEITLEGYADIQFWQMEAVKTLELALFNGEENPCAPYTKVRKWHRDAPLHVFQTNLKLGYRSGDMATATCFDDVYAAFLRQFAYQNEQFLAQIAQTIRKDLDTEERQTSLLVAGLTPGSLDTGCDPIRGGFDVPNYQLLSGSLPTVADALQGIRTVVFQQRACTMPEMLAALRNNFEGNEVLRQRCLNAPKYGNGNCCVDSLAAELVEFFIDQVESYKFPYAVPVLPGIYNIDFVMFASIIGATPDGRRAGDPICVHYSPTPGFAQSGPTAALISAANAELTKGCAASPIYLTLPASPANASSTVIGSLIRGVMELHLPVVNLSIADRSVLEKALENPEQHRDVVVRVWGYNAHFVDLDSTLQEHIIGRILPH